MLESLFNEVAGLFYGRPPVAIFMSTRKGRIGKRGTKECSLRVHFLCFHF